MKENISVRFGIKEYKKGNKSLDKLLKDSTIALNDIDSFDVNNYIFFNETMNLVIKRAETIENEFIEIAEREQLIIPLSKLILDEAGNFMYKLIKQGYSHLYIAVNISTIHVFQDDFVTTIFDSIDRTGVEGRNLELEITETAFMDNFNRP